MFPRSRVPTSSPSIAYQPVASDDDGKDVGQSDDPGAVDDELVVDRTSDVDAGDMEIFLTEKDNTRILCKIDKVILSLLVWVYFLQILDKTILGYSAILGLPQDTHLTGSQYSIVGSIAPIAQLIWQPVSSLLIVKVPHRTLMPCLVFGWGLAQTLTPTCRSFTGLVINRFFLGLFEAGCLPLFSIITSQWYRRHEQPLRVAAWYGTNGLATILAAVLAFLLPPLPPPWQWQSLYLLTGLLTLLTVPLIHLRLPNDIPSAPFLTPTERLQALERVRANQTGVGGPGAKFQPAQAREALTDRKTYLFLLLAFANNLGAQVTNTFGPLILAGIGAFPPRTTTLLNIPFGATQYAVIIAVALFATRIRYKSAALVAVIVPILVGLGTLYAVPRDGGHDGVLVAGYYLLAFIFGGNTLIVAWILGNTGGQTKKAVVMGLYNAASAGGNVVGPLLFAEGPEGGYKFGLRVTLGVFAAMVVVVGGKGRGRGVVDRSMEGGVGGVGVVGGGGLEDVTDRENPGFVYVY
ncbi:major facilitator superfamily domain-containing protein [Podospora conica]|nr:major facilitator superfamily domain-containing protein [Schizothecium conicum]